MDYPVGQPRPFFRVLRSIPGYLYVRVGPLVLLRDGRRVIVKGAR